MDSYRKRKCLLFLYEITEAHRMAVCANREAKGLHAVIHDGVLISRGFEELAEACEGKVTIYPELRYASRATFVYRGVEISNYYEKTNPTCLRR